MYYLYENWTAIANSGTVHHAECGRCNNGAGMHRKAQAGRAGVWIGPFSSLEYVVKYVHQRQLVGKMTCACLNNRLAR